MTFPISGPSDEAFKVFEERIKQIYNDYVKEVKISKDKYMEEFKEAMKQYNESCGNK